MTGGAYDYLQQIVAAMEEVRAAVFRGTVPSATLV